MAVSYTHLDVYKRQSHNTSNLKKHVTSVHKIVFTEHEHPNNKIRNSESVTSEEMAVEEPVPVHYISKSLSSLSSVINIITVLKY